MKSFIFLILIFVSSISHGKKTTEVNDILEGTKWIIVSIDSAGIVLPISKDTLFYIEFNSVKNSYHHYRRREKKHMIKRGFKELAIYTEFRNWHTKYYCQIRARYTINNLNKFEIKTYWDDHFKVQETFSDWGGKYRTWIRYVLNSKCRFIMTNNELKIIAYDFRDKEMNLIMNCVKVASVSSH